MNEMARNLLNTVIGKIYELQVANKSVAENTNILSILGKDSDEVIMCKVLWALLNFQVDGKRIFLKGFISNILKYPMNETELSNANVYREYCIPQNSRRIDLVIKTTRDFIPIEAKIYAGDQYEQCADYIKYAGGFYKSNSEVTLYYLTLDRHSPAEYSMAGNESLLNQIKLISWIDILGWLNGMGSTDTVADELKGQFIKALETLLNRKRRQFEMKIDELIDSPDGMKAAMEIEKAINRKKTALLHLIFEEVISKASQETNLHLDPKLNEPWDYRKGIDDYYSRRKSSSTYPALTFNIGLLNTSNEGMEYYLIIRFEIEWRAYIGFAIMKRNSKGELFTENHPSDEMITLVKSRMVNPDIISYNKDWWLYWEYVSSNNQEPSEIEPDFRTMNDAYLGLYDDDKRELFIDGIVSMLKKFRGNIKSFTPTLKGRGL